MKLMLVNKHELEMGIEKESSEHGMSREEARKTALDHLKERPDYYSVADKAGLEEEGMLEWNDSIFTKEKTSGGGRYGRVKKAVNKMKRSRKKHIAGAPAVYGAASNGIFEEGN